MESQITVKSLAIEFNFIRIFSVFIMRQIWFSDSVNGSDNRRYSSSLATKGVGHLARKGTGGRSSVRYLSFWFLKKCYLVCVIRITPSLVCSSLYSSFELKKWKKSWFLLWFCQWDCSYSVWSHWVSWSLSCAAARWVWFNLANINPGTLFFWFSNYVANELLLPAKMGSQVLVPFRGSEDNPRHLKLMGDLGQVISFLSFFCLTQWF